MATKKKKTTKKTNKRPKISKAEQKRLEKKRKVITTISLILLYIFTTVLLFLSFYSGILGESGIGIRDFFRGVFGSASYVFPFAMIFGFFYYFIKKKQGGGYGKLYILGGMLLCISVLSQLHAFKDTSIALQIEDLYRYGIDNSAGGIIAGFVAEAIKSVISYLGAAILFWALVVFLFILFFYEPLALGYTFISEALKDINEGKDKKEKAPKKEKEPKKEKTKKPDKEEEIKPDEEEAPPKKTFDISSIWGKDEEPEKEDKIPATDNIVDIVPDFDEPEYEEDKEPLEQGDDDVRRTEAEEALLREKEELEGMLEGKAENDGQVEFTDRPINRRIEYKFPSVELLEDNKAKGVGTTREALAEKVSKLENVLNEFGVDADVVNVEIGPAITRFEVQPKSGVRIAKIQSLQDDIKMHLAASSIRIAPIPGKTVVGIEIPNDKTTPVFVKELISSGAFTDHKSKLAFTVGMDITGKPVIGDLAKMPHVLIAGATGSGKSVCINTLITSILYKATPNEVKLIMIDPKVVELATYNGIPHLLIPVVTDPKKASSALNWAVMEMENRYKLFSQYGVKNIEGYNEYCEEHDDEEGKLPKIVIIIDELADLMMVASKEVEASICRIAQLARAAGMHLVIATQRPSVNVITGLIKANVPSRIAFAVSSQIDSRTILDMAGAEKLLGKGDMLYYPAGESKPLRVQGSFIHEKETERVVNVVKANSEVTYDEDIIEHLEKSETFEGDTKTREEEALDADELLPQAIEVILDANQASVSLLQRRLKLGYSRAARIVDQMEERGIVGPSEGSKPRQILITKEQFYEMNLNSDVQ